MHRETFFCQVYEDHRQAIHGYLLGRTGDPEMALDLMQETFLRAWRHLSTLQGIAEDRRRFWLFAVARNVATDHVRRDVSRSAVVGELVREASLAKSAPDDPPKRAEERERVQDLDRAIRALPEELRTVLAMQVLGGMTSVRIGTILEMPAGTVRYRISLARKQLASALRLIDSPPKAEEGEQ